MCGIAGWFDNHRDLRENRETLMAMSAQLRRRGPDEQGEYIKKNCALLHRRLSVIDPENGQQPMSTLYLGEKYTIVYNGELYNTEELRLELMVAGFTRLQYTRKRPEGCFSVATGSASSRCFIISITTGSSSAQRSKQS